MLGGQTAEILQGRGPARRRRAMADCPGPSVLCYKGRLAAGGYFGRAAGGRRSSRRRGALLFPWNTLH